MGPEGKAALSSHTACKVSRTVSPLKRTVVCMGDAGEPLLSIAVLYHNWLCTMIVLIEQSSGQSVSVGVGTLIT